MRIIEENKLKDINNIINPIEILYKKLPLLYRLEEQRDVLFFFW